MTRDATKLRASEVTDPRHLRRAIELADRLAAAIGPDAKVGVERYGPGSYGLTCRWGASHATAFAEGPADDTGALRVTVLVGTDPARTELIDALRKAGIWKANR